MKSEKALRSPARSSFGPNEAPAAIVPSRLTVDEFVSGLARLQRNIRNEADLDKFLKRLVEATRLLLGASGAAIALRDRRLYRWRARSGEIGPPIGAPLSSEGGIAGGCLASGRIQYCQDTSNDVRVEAVHCRLLGLASIAAVPVARGRNIDGVLEAWSSQSRAFDRRRLQLLQDLARLAAIVGKGAARRRVRVVPHWASFLMQQASCTMAMMEIRHKWARAVSDALRNTRDFVLEGVSIHTPSSDNLITVAFRYKWAPAASEALRLTTDFVRDMLNRLKRAPAQLPSRTRRLGRLGFPVVPVAFVLAMLPWAIWRGQTAETTLASVSPPFQEARPVLAPLPVKTSLESLSLPFTRSTPPELLPRSRQVTRAVPLYRVPKDASGQPLMKVPGIHEHPGMIDDSVPPAIPAVAKVAASDNVAGLIANLLSIRPDIPTLLETSHGLTGGDLRVRTQPAYPDMARSAGIEGTVKLEAVIDEQGHVQDITVTAGQPILARAAMAAVKQWLYHPYLLGDRPVRMPTEISVVFKLGR
jgi:TonB family protein